MESARKFMVKQFGFKNFKSPDQEYAVSRIIQSVGANKKNIVLSMATQAGKSLAYHLLGSMRKFGVTVVISPSIALIDDQISFLRDHRISAAAIVASTAFSERDEIMEELRADNGNIKFLFVTPEMVASNAAISNFLKCGNINFFIVEEAHKFIDTADFRPDFDILKIFRKHNKSIPWIALTTADDGFCNAIGKALGMKNTENIITSSVRENIFYDIKSMNALNDIGEYIKENLKTSSDSKVPSGIVYCKKLDDADDVLSFLFEDGVVAGIYHAERRNKNEVLNAWIEQRFPVLIATDESFGFGINYNVPNIRFVIHVSPPKNMRHFYQESGRAGNDGRMGYSRIYASHGDFDSSCLKDYFNGNCRRQAVARFFGELADACFDNCDNCLELHHNYSDDS